MPRTQLAWTKGDVPDVARAVSIMTTMQRLSAVPLGVDLIQARGWTAATLSNAQAGAALAAGTLGALQHIVTSIAGALAPLPPKTSYTVDASPVASAPIVAGGGIARAEDVVAALAAGASAVQMGTALIRDPRAGVTTLDALRRHCAELSMPPSAMTAVAHR